ncbi:MAG TPA: class I SAM-dependent methyltransferase [Candidatus Hydrogenedentes bacterium]|jgi:2-polyprenyl-3-methyl-5-hydroxy-6-metoxy-1,4-benzoquinol methylase|nr:class I SAM-dependent methyltransferase [Candidatus Hydrogenedentota bacterium]HOC67976.1 class I SAM-dependent methyltransferase [Candidatus Hydrogenedentota bacterium]
MTGKDDHYSKTVAEGKRTRFARCGFKDRFDPFRLSQVPRLRRLYEMLFSEFLGETRHERLLDIGCGSGIYFEALAAHAATIYGVDASFSMASVARAFCRDRELGHFALLAGTAEALPYPGGTFDTVIAMDVLHHVHSVDRVVGEVYRVLKPGGRFFVFEPNILNPLVWCAHALPREERLALVRNRPATLRTMLETRFDTVRWQGVCALITETAGLRRGMIDLYLALWHWTGCETFYPRQAWLGVKPERN